MQVLFVCVGNSARSQMAEGFFNVLAPERVKAVSAGTKPAARVSSKTVEVMREVGIDIDIKNQSPTLVTQDMIENVARIVTMGCLDEGSCPAFLVEDSSKSKLVDWEIRDPRAMPLEEYRKVRDAIKKKVEALVEEFS
ncbi:MAG: arsenate reductase ArsC [Candidatus Hydrothermarchaeales archaeon]